MLMQKLVVLLTFLSGFAVYQNVVSTMYSIPERSTVKEALGGNADYSSLSLVPGELPGYTGWSRPESTLAGNFKMYKAPLMGQVGEPWTLVIVCNHAKCTNGGAHFYVRAYGPAVITGQVEDNHDGTYNIVILPMDPGNYTVEVVLVSSYSPDFDSYPMVPESPAYEGYLVSGFPIQLTVQESSKVSRVGEMTSHKLCLLDQLVETDSNSAYGKRRWVVTDKVSNRRYELGFNNTNQNVSLRGYQSSKNSLGIMMDYVPSDCSMLQSSLLGTDKFHELVGQCRKDHKNQSVHVIFVGDSVSLLQQIQFKQSLLEGSPDITSTRISTSGGIHVMMSNVTAELDAIKENFPDERRFVIFNTGLHDVAQLCSEKYSAIRTDVLNQSDTELSCSVEYRKHFTRLVQYMADYPAELKVFQSTTAGWLRYGNFGFSWPPHIKQVFSMSPNMVAHFNSIAFDVLKEYQDTIQVMDAYWMTLARPDNREINIENSIGKHMVHPGLEVLSALRRTWWMIILRSMCGDRLDDVYREIFRSPGS